MYQFIAIILVFLIIITFLPYLQDQLKQPTFSFVIQDRNVCPNKLYGSFDIQFRNIGDKIGILAVSVSSEEISFITKNNLPSHLDQLSYVILPKEFAQYRFVPQQNYTYSSLKNIKIKIKGECFYQFFNNTVSCGTLSKVCYYINNGYPSFTDFTLSGEE
jgi:hypothetical protein